MRFPSGDTLGSLVSPSSFKSGCAVACPIPAARCPNKQNGRTTKIGTRSHNPLIGDFERRISMIRG
jgi:hypothetical protein